MNSREYLGLQHLQMLRAGWRRSKPASKVVKQAMSFHGMRSLHKCERARCHLYVIAKCKTTLLHLRPTQTMLSLRLMRLLSCTAHAFDHPHDLTLP